MPPLSLMFFFRHYAKKIRHLRCLKHCFVNILVKYFVKTFDVLHNFVVH
jgi:hypothetical protein